MYTLPQPKEKPTPMELLPVFEELLPVKVIQELVKACKRHFYQRLLTPLIMVWCLIYQRLNEDHSCDAAVSHISSGALDHLDNGHKEPVSERMKSESTAAYCKGRKRLPQEVLQAGIPHTAQVIRQWLGPDGLWLGRHSVGLIDGTTLLLQPTPELVKHYGQHQNQHGQTYWVLVRVVAAFCLSSGTLLDVEEGSLHTSEQAMAKDVFAHSVADSVYVGDCNFGVYSVAQAAHHYGIWPLLRLTYSRARVIAGGKLGTDEDRQVEWKPSQSDQRHPGMSDEPIAGRLICVRVQRQGFRPVQLYLFTTLMDKQLYNVQELVRLYSFRWHVELDLRYVKATLDMGLLTAKSVDMIRKELYAGLLAYNIIRGYMVKAAQAAHLSPLTLSFTKCWRRVQEMLLSVWPIIPTEQLARRIHLLLTKLARCKLPNRPRYRIEPRAKRRRPNAYPYLKGSRDEARQRLLEQRLAT